MVVWSNKNVYILSHNTNKEKRNRYQYYGIQTNGWKETSCPSPSFPWSNIFTNLDWIEESLKKTLNCCKLKIVFKNKAGLSNTFHFKDRSSKDLTSGVIYKFQWGLCNTPYYDEFVRHLNIRIGEHTGISPFTKKQVKVISSENFGIIKAKLRQKPKPNSSHFGV